MKKVFFVLITMFFLLFFVFIFNKKSSISDKMFYSDNISIVYPFFNNRYIDDYIVKYLNNVIDNTYSGYSLDIDYDYVKDNNIYSISFYNFFVKDNIVKEKIDYFVIDVVNNSIDVDSDSEVSNYYYDGYYQKFVDKNKPLVAITFDDGPNYNTSKIIELLNKYNVKSTFFVLGKNASLYNDIIKNMVSYGMEIGNHTYSHSILNNKKMSYVKGEFDKCNDIIFDIIGKYPNLYRTSYGSINNKILNSIDGSVILWDIDTLDWKYHNSKRIYDRVINNVSDGDIILMHDIYSSTYKALEIIVPELLKRGYQLVTVSDLFYYKGISLERGNVYGMAK